MCGHMSDMSGVRNNNVHTIITRLDTLTPLAKYLTTYNHSNSSFDPPPLPTYTGTKHFLAEIPQVNVLKYLLPFSAKNTINTIIS